MATKFAGTEGEMERLEAVELVQRRLDVLMLRLVEQ